MRLALFSNTYRPFVGGVTRSIDSFVREFQKKGHEVRLFAPRFSDYKDTEEWIQRVPAIPRFNATDFSLPLPFSLKVRSIFDKMNPDLVHVQHPFFLGEMGMHLGKNKGLPIVLTYHTQYEQYSHYAPIDSDLIKRWIINVCTSFCNICDLVVAPSTDIREMLVAREVRVRIQVIPTGLDLSAFRQPDRQWLRNAFGIGRDKKILLHVGRLAKEKNLDFLFASAARAMKEEKDLIFLVAGQGDQEASLRELAHQLGIGGRVLFHGKMAYTELVNAYAGADLFVFSSKSETQGLVVLESMAAGTPAIALDAPGVRDVIVNGENGYLVREDPRLFSERILEMMRSPERRQAFSLAGLERARAFSSSAMADRLLEEYALLLEKPPGTLNPEVHRFKIFKGLLQEAVRSVKEKGSTLS